MSTPMLDVSLEIEGFQGAPKWRVRLRSPEGDNRTNIDPITDADLATVPELPDRNWPGVIARLRPGLGLDLQHLTLLGERLMSRLLADPELRRHLQRLEARQQRQRVPLRFLLDIQDDGDSLLADLPLELLHDGDGFIFRRGDRPSLRCAPRGGAHNLRLAPGARALLVTAHADDPPHPSQEELKDHAQAVEQVLHAAGYQPRWLEEATAPALRQTLLAEPVDILYVACHGLENHREYGALQLRDGPLSGHSIGEWLEEARWQHGRPVQVVLLCACSSAVPQAERGTSGMAQWLVRPGRAMASLGFRGPVAVAWALKFSERLFEHLGQGRPLEDAFARARSAADASDPQWVLPLLYGRPQDLNALLENARGLPIYAESVAAPTLRSIPPRAPRPFFTGRAEPLARLQGWLRQPGAAQISGLEGGGGIGQTELACYAAHERLTAGWPVLWLESPERDLRSALATLIAAAQPNFTLTPDHTVEV